MKIKQEKGITLMLLIITVIVLLIIAGIAIYSGTETIKKASVEDLKTNMLLIQAKVKGYVEEVSFQMGTHPENLSQEEKDNIRNKVYCEEGKLIKESFEEIPDEERENAYKLREDALKKMGLEKLDKSKCYGVFA